jgi:hypothetical protein
MNRGILEVIAVCVLLCCSNLPAENIDPYRDDSQYAYGENVGWLNFEPGAGDGVHVTSDGLSGFVWAENIGWINLSPESYGGVFNDGHDNLSGFAWAENAGWINFSPQYGGVTIDKRGYFSGWAWGENIGWINFNSAQLYNRGVRTCKVAFEDLANFADDWLAPDPTSPANLTSPPGVDWADYAAFASYWRDYCPDGWELK